MNEIRHENKYPENWDKLRRVVYESAKYTCQFCGDRCQGINAHHIIALSKGGKNDLNNLILFSTNAILFYIRQIQDYEIKLSLWCGE